MPTCHRSERSWIVTDRILLTTVTGRRAASPLRATWTPYGCRADEFIRLRSDPGCQRHRLSIAPSPGIRSTDHRIRQDGHGRRPTPSDDTCTWNTGARPRQHRPGTAPNRLKCMATAVHLPPAAPPHPGAANDQEPPPREEQNRPDTTRTGCSTTTKPTYTAPIPNDPDTDGDGRNDGLEVFENTDTRTIDAGCCSVEPWHS